MKMLKRILLFLALGALLFLFAQSHHIPLPAKADDLFPTIVAGGYLPPVVTVLFVLGLIGILEIVLLVGIVLLVSGLNGILLL